MGHYSARLAEAYGLSAKECDTILMAGLMHDVGKIGIPDHILFKPGKLDQEEWGIMKTHTTIGSKILADSTSDLVKIGQRIRNALGRKHDEHRGD